MKLTKRRPAVNEEESITIIAHDSNEKVAQIMSILTSENTLTVYQESQLFKIKPQGVYYVESVDFKTYVYTEVEVYVSRLRLYEIEQVLSSSDFMRINRQALLNIRKIKSVASAGGGRIEVVLKSGDKLIVSRQYAPVLKERFGL